MIIRTYRELVSFATFEERFRYLKLNGEVGKDTFGFDRIFNQQFYKSREWKQIRDLIILRDTGCDLGVDGYDIQERIIIHHMNPIMLSDIKEGTEFLMNPEYLICTTHDTHNAIHYGNMNMIMKAPVQRSKNDTCPWRR